MALFAGAAALVAVAATRRGEPLELPALDSVEAPDGTQVVVCDDRAMGDAFERVGLPRPPALDGTDPVPAEEVLKRVRAWDESRDGELLGEVGMIFLALGQNREALAYFAAARELDSGEPQWTYFLAAACQRLAYRREAIELLDAYLATGAGHPTAYARLGLLHLELEEYDAALEHYESYRKLAPRQAMAYVGLGRAQLGKGNVPRAVQALERAVQLNERDFLAHRFLAQALIASGRDEDAQEAMETADSLPTYKGWLNFDPELKRAYELARSQHFLENELRLAVALNSFAYAHSIADDLIARRPRDPDLLANKARVFLREGNPAAAEGVFGKALELRPDSFELNLELGRARFLQDDYEGARAVTDRLFELEPENPALFDLRARCLLKLGDRVAAVETMEQAVALQPDKVDYHMVMAGLAQDAGLPERARAAYEEARRLAPDHPALRVLAKQLGEE